jgi:hypothetical protein
VVSGCKRTTVTGSRPSPLRPFAFTQPLFCDQSAPNASNRRDISGILLVLEITHLAAIQRLFSPVAAIFLLAKSLT